MSPAIALEGVTLAYRRDPVLHAVDLAVAAGEVLALLGPSASGKSSVLRVVLGFSRPSAGVVRVGERVVSRDRRLLVPPEERGLAVVFQDLALWPHLTVAENVTFGLEARGVPGAAAAERAAAMLERVGLTGVERRRPGDLSGGQRQRVAIARALVLEPRAVLLDEPLSNVDVVMRRELLQLLRELFRERPTTAVYVTHDLSEAMAVASRFAVIEEGRIVQQGSLAELGRAPATAFVAALLAEVDSRAPAAAAPRSAPTRRSP